MGKKIKKKTPKERIVCELSLVNEIAVMFECTAATVYNALAFRTNNFRALQIREYAEKNGGYLFKKTKQINTIREKWNSRQ